MAARRRCPYNQNIMQDKEKLDVLCRLLESYQVADKVSPDEIKNFKTYKSQLYGMAHVYSFGYKDRRYYVTDDYSLMDNPKYVQDVFAEIDPQTTGTLLKNPAPQSDGATYASGLNGAEYYLWESS